MAKRLFYFDTTLRDGAQTPGVGMDLWDRLVIAKALAYIGVDIIEIGFGANNAEFEMIRQMAKYVGNEKYSVNGHVPVVCSLARAIPDDVKRAYLSIEPADPSKRRIHIFIATSDELMQYSLEKSEQEVHSMIRESVPLAVEYMGADGEVEFSCEDALNTPLDRLVRSCQLAIDLGATIINVPDTTGMASPERYYDTLVHLRNNLRNAERVTFSVHNHNDLGLAVATTLAGIRAGATQFEGCINQLGERAGNVDGLVVATALSNMSEYKGQFDLSHLKMDKFYGISRLVSSITGLPVPPTHPVTGETSFDESAGIHVAGVLKALLKKAKTYFRIDAQSVGREIGIVIGQTSGYHTVAHFLRNFGYGDVEENYSWQQLEAMTDYSKRRAISFRDALTDTEARLYAEHYIRNKPLEERIMLEDFHSSNSLRGGRAVEISLKVDGIQTTGYGTGEGTVDAYMNAMHNAFGFPPGTVQLHIWEEKAIYRGPDAPGFELLKEIPFSQEEKDLLEGICPISVGQQASAKSMVKLKVDSEMFDGRGVSPDVDTANYLAITNAFDAMIRLR